MSARGREPAANFGDTRAHTHGDTHADLRTGTHADAHGNLPDDSTSRHAIRTKLDTTMLVEAGAGSGKTTLMVERLLEYIARGTPVDQLAAVTFTKKAANELRQRLESKVEHRARTDAEPGRERFAAALRDRERMFIGTVHAFCGRILREYAFEAGLPPDFTELDETESALLREASWRSFVEHAARQNSATLTNVAAVGVDALSLFKAFKQREQYRDVNFPAPAVSAPPHEDVRDALVRLLRAATNLRQSVQSSERDRLQRSIDRLWRSHQLHNGWTSGAEFAQESQLLLSATSRELVQKHWGDSKDAKRAAKELRSDVDDFVGSQLEPWFARWWAHVYAPVIALLDAGSEWALSQRRRAGELGFDDLLTEAASLLRTNAAARQSIGERWRYLLVDEFQDTDPVQAEVCFLIASEPAEGNDWRTVRLRPGSLFVVGDPKQSIYRFRRADLAMYQFVQQRIAECGSVQRLTRNFRSVQAIGEVVNEHFVQVFTAAGATASSDAPQAPFANLVAAATRAPHAAAGVARYLIGKGGKASNEALIAEDAALIASWITRRCSEGGDRRPQDFLILTPRKAELAAYAHELAVRNIPVSVAGAPGAADDVLGELLVVLRALADPANPIAVIAALEGWCVGCSHADLWDARELGLAFDITGEPRERQSPAGAGLVQLHRWWLASQRLPAATLLERVLDDSGLLVIAASSDLGDSSAGRLLQLVSTLHGGLGTDLATAIEVIEQSLADDNSSATLRPARIDAVRLMNLHKAKGLEAPVVILAAPVAAKARTPKVATWREDGIAVGALRVIDDNDQTVAQPADWALREAEETARESAEWDRLLYVATTRAEEELIVSQRAPFRLASGETRGDGGRWASLAAVLSHHAHELKLTVDPPEGRKELIVPVEQLRAAIARAEERVAQAKPARYVLISVTDAVKLTAAQAEHDGAPRVLAHVGEEGFAAGADDTPEPQRDDVPRSAVDPQTFGSLVHAVIEGALRGRAGTHLAAYARALVWHALAEADDNTREGLVAEILRALDEARQTPSWALLTSAERKALPELNVASFSVKTNTAVLTEGVIDAAVMQDGEWVVVDWKLNRSSDAAWRRQLEVYERQALSYTEALKSRTGADGTPRIERLSGRS